MSSKKDPSLLLEKIQARLSDAQSAISKNKSTSLELETLYSVIDLVSSISDIDRLLEGLIDLAIGLTQGERGMIILVCGDKKELAVRVARNIDKHDLIEAGDISRGIVREVFDSGEGFISMDAQNDDRLKKNKSIFEHRIHAMICVPIVFQKETMGVLYVDNRSITNVFTKQQKDFLDGVARLAGVMIQKAQLEQKIKAELTSKSDEVNLLRKEVQNRFRNRHLIGNSPAIRKVFSLIDAVADSSTNVLIIGESGTGKELIARALHYQSPRQGKPFVAINCAALPDELLETELFGHEKGAFTNAFSLKKGKFEMAEGGTLFLDEIGDMSSVTQAKVLRAIQEKEFTRVGGNKNIKVNIRIVAATNRNLVEAVKEGTFREDLFFRLNVITLEVPPLRDRREDIPLLVDHFLRKYAEENHKPIPTLTLEARDLLIHAPWPGNIRELESAINQGVVLSENNIITVTDLPKKLRDSTPDGDFQLERGLLDLKEETVRNLEEKLVRLYLDRTSGNVAAASRLAGVSRVNFYRLLKKYDIQ